MIHLRARRKELPKDIELDVEEARSEEGRIPRTLRGPGTPTQDEADHINTTYIAFRSWCPACVAGRARARHHKKKENQGDKRVPEVVFDYTFLGAEGERAT